MGAERASRRAAAGLAAALLVFVLAAVALAACGGGEEEEATPTAAPTPSPTATPTAAATATPEPSPTAVPALTPWPTPTRIPLSPGALTPAATTPAPPPGGQTPALMPSWQTSAPREPVTAGSAFQLGIRNENGAPGETHAIGVQVNLPDGSPANMEGKVVGDEWTYFPFDQTALAGTYTVYFGVPQSAIIFAEDSFEVYAAGPPPGGGFPTLSWQTSAPGCLRASARSWSWGCATSSASRANATTS
jgi:hypothetical protein